MGTHLQLGSGTIMFFRFRPSALMRLRRFSHTRSSRLIIDQSGIQQSIELTEAAVKRLEQIAETKGHDRILRLAVESGGCHGFQYKFALEPVLDVSSTDDIVFTRGEGKLVVDEVSLKLLSGSQVDFSTELIGSAFRVIQNPRADSGCGCGVSFNLTKKPFTAPSIDNEGLVGLATSLIDQAGTEEDGQSSNQSDPWMGTRPHSPLPRPCFLLATLLLLVLLTNHFHRRTTLTGWGILAGTVAVFLVERIPAFRRDIFCKLPLIGDRYAAYRVHEEDEPSE